MGESELIDAVGGLAETADADAPMEYSFPYLRQSVTVSVRFACEFEADVRIGYSVITIIHCAINNGPVS